GHVIRWSIVQGLLAGVCLALLALVTGWLLRRTYWFRLLVLVLLAVTWALPGPVLGLGLKDTISLVLDATDDAPILVDALYRGPSPIPVLWVQIVRFWPCALALIWPFVRQVPDELYDAAALDGSKPWQQLVYVVGPLALPTCLRTIVAVLIL